MRIIYEAFDGEKFNTEEACLRHEKESPLFKTYNLNGYPIEVGQGVHLLHIIDNARGGEAFQRLCEERDEDSGLVDNCSRAGWYWWDDDYFSSVDEGLIRAMMRARYNIDIAN